MATELSIPNAIEWLELVLETLLDDDDSYEAEDRAMVEYITRVLRK